MMNLNEYFESLRETMTCDEIIDLEEEVYALYEEGDGSAFDEWAAAHNIDTTVTKVVLGDPINIVTLWVWDMDGDC